MRIPKLNSIGAKTPTNPEHGSCTITVLTFFPCALVTFSKTKNEQYLKYLLSLSDSWMQINVQQDINKIKDVPYMAWDDHATTLRMMNMALLWKTIHDEHLEKKFEKQLSFSKGNHSSRLFNNGTRLFLRASQPWLLSIDWPYLHL